MRHGSWVLAIAFGGVFAAPNAMAQDSAPGIAETRTLRCESGDGRDRHCPMDTRGGVRLVRQLSRTACVEGRSWGVESRGVWVGQGCRAEFVAGRGGSDPGSVDTLGRVVRCESTSGRSNLCVMDTRRGVELIRQLSRSACMRERNWGWNEQGVWVSGGCRAEFRARGWRAPARKDGDAGGGGQIVRCESMKGRVQRCPIETSGAARLIRQLSRTQCVEGRNWGFDRVGIWVEAGCRADFEVAPKHRWSGR